VIMYEQFFGLKEDPFNITSDPAFFFSGKSHSQAYSCLLYGIEQRKGLIKITGEVGTGKTTLCRALINRLGPQVKTSCIFNPYFSEVQLLEAITEDFGIVAERKNKLSIVRQLNEFLLERASCGENAVLIIDEAQNLKARQLEQIRLLSNLETDKKKILQIVLVGQPELDKKLSNPNLRQIDQRIAVRYSIQPLQEDETRGYIMHRIKIAGGNGKIDFTKGALELVYSFSQGFPRLINILCDRALLAGFVRKSFTIDESIIKQCTEEL